MPYRDRLLPASAFRDGLPDRAAEDGQVLLLRGVMRDVTEERDIDSLFSDGHTTALTQAIAGLDDFELTAFIAIVDTTEGTT